MLGREGGMSLRLPSAGSLSERVAVERLGAELAVIDKRRSDDGTAEVMNVIGDVHGRTCIIQDDIIDTAGTIVKAASALKANGADRVFASAVHGVLSGPAIERIEKSPLDQLIVTNTIPLNGERAKNPKIVSLSVARSVSVVSGTAEYQVWSNSSRSSTRSSGAARRRWARLRTCWPRSWSARSGRSAS